MDWPILHDTSLDTAATKVALGVQASDVNTFPTRLRGELRRQQGG